jgi:hypothetical protein
MVDGKVICGDSSRRWGFSKVNTEFSMGIHLHGCLLKDSVLAVRHTVWTAFETRNIKHLLATEVNDIIKYTDHTVLVNSPKNKNRIKSTSVSHIRAVQCKNNEDTYKN